MRGMLRLFGRTVVEFCKIFWDIVRHRNINKAFAVVPIDSYTGVACASPVNGKIIFLSRAVKRCSASDFEVLNTKIVNCQCESGRTTFMAPQNWGVFHGDIPGFGRIFSELFISKYGRFFQPIHNFSNFQVDIAFGIEKLSVMLYLLRIYCVM